MTIYEIKRLTATTSPHFFTRSTLKFFGQTMKSFSVRKCADGRYKMSAPMRRWDNGRWIDTGNTMRYFNPANNELEREETK